LPLSGKIALSVLL